jgi:hypothetical protein
MSKAPRADDKEIAIVTVEHGEVTTVTQFQTTLAGWRQQEQRFAAVKPKRIIVDEIEERGTFGEATQSSVETDVVERAVGRTE